MEYQNGNFCEGCSANRLCDTCQHEDLIINSNEQENEVHSETVTLPVRAIVKRALNYGKTQKKLEGNQLFFAKVQAGFTPVLRETLGAVMLGLDADEAYELLARHPGIFKSHRKHARKMTQLVQALRDTHISGAEGRFDPVALPHELSEVELSDSLTACLQPEVVYQDQNGVLCVGYFICSGTAWPKGEVDWIVSLVSECLIKCNVSARIAIVQVQRGEIRLFEPVVLKTLPPLSQIMAAGTQAANAD